MLIGLVEEGFFELFKIAGVLVAHSLPDHLVVLFLSLLHNFPFLKQHLELGFIAACETVWLLFLFLLDNVHERFRRNPWTLFGFGCLLQTLQEGHAQF